MRAREFLMKDAYSFHTNQASLEQVYEKMYQAYKTIFTRIGLKFRAVEAHTGNIGGSYSHEFHALAQSGEDCLVYADQGDYAANIELAKAWVSQDPLPQPTGKLEKFATPGMKTILDLADHMGILPTRGVKTLIVKGTDTPLVALVLRGDHQLNLLKAESLPEVLSPLQMAEEAEIRRLLEVSPGSIGVVNLKIPFIVDHSAAALSDFVCGANEDGFHYRSVNWGRDAPLERVVDIRNVVEGDRSPDGVGILSFTRGVELGHLFQLGDLYTRRLGVTVLQESGKPMHPLMGCFGIGVSRTVAAMVEQSHDHQGIIWPEAIAPFQVALLPLNTHKSYRVHETSEQLFHLLQQAKIEVLLDDRKERAGVKFAEMDLIGIPHHIIISERGMDKGTVEYKPRIKGHPTSEWRIDQVVTEMTALLQRK